MRVIRALPLALALAAMPLWPAAAQFGGMPGMPGSPGMSPAGPGMSTPGGAFSAPQEPPPACQQLLAIRDEVGKHGKALQAAGEKKAPAEELCKLFKAFLASEGKLLKGLQGHGKASEVGKKVCDAAAQGPRQAAPSLADALGAAPTVPDASAARKKGASTFDTLTGSPLGQ